MNIVVHDSDGKGSQAAIIRELSGDTLEFEQKLDIQWVLYNVKCWQGLNGDLHVRVIMKHWVLMQLYNDFVAGRIIPDFGNENEKEEKS